MTELPTVLAGWLLASSVGLTLSLVMFGKLVIRARRTRQAGINGEVANIQNATRVRLSLFIAACASGVVVAMYPTWDGIRGFGFIALVVIAWSAVAESKSGRRAEELAADRLMRDRMGSLS